MSEHAFISYVRENSDLVDKLAAELRANGVEVWLDRDDILPGEYWQDAISTAIADGAFFIACYSSEMDSRKETYMHGELRLAIDRLRSMPRERIWFIPVMLNEAKIPRHPISGHETLSDINTIDLFNDWDASVRTILRVMGIEDKDVQKIRRIRKTHRDNDGSDIVLASQLMDSLRQFHGPDSPLLHGFANKDYEVRSRTIGYFNESHRASVEILDYFNEIGRRVSKLSEHFSKDSDLLPREEVYVKLLETISEIGPYLDYLIDDLKNVIASEPPYRVAYSTLRAIGKIGTIESGALSYLTKLATDTTFPHQESAVLAIGDFERLGVPAIDALKSVFNECTHDCKLEIIYTLGQIRHVDTDTLEFIIHILSDENEKIRERSANALGFISRTQTHNTRISEAIIPVLKDTSSRVRAEAIYTLTCSLRYVPGIVDGVIAVLDDRDSVVVNAACDVVSRLGSRAEEAAPKLHELLVSGNKQSIDRIIDALGEIGPAALPSKDALITLYLSRDPNISLRAYRAIERIVWER